jgi:seryl-tRNA synthetase
MPAILLIKYGQYFLAVAFLALGIKYIYDKGYDSCESKWLVTMQRQEKLNANVQASLTKKIKEQETKNEQMSHELEVKANDYQEKLNDLQASLTSAKLKTRGVCKSSGSTASHPIGVSESKSTHDTNQATDQDELTPEFQRFLISSFRRGDEAGNYAQIAHDFISQHLDLNGNFVCDVTEK